MTYNVFSTTLNQSINQSINQPIVDVVNVLYVGHARLSVCVSVCPRLHAHTTARTRM